MINVLCGQIAYEDIESPDILLIERDTGDALKLWTDDQKLRARMLLIANAQKEAVLYFRIRPERLELYEAKEYNPLEKIPTYVMEVLFCTRCRTKLYNADTPCDCDTCPECTTPLWTTCPSCSFTTKRSVDRGKPERVTRYIQRTAETKFVCVSLGKHTLCGHKIQPGETTTTPPTSCPDCIDILGELYIIHKETNNPYFLTEQPDGTES